MTIPTAEQCALIAGLTANLSHCKRQLAAAEKNRNAEMVRLCLRATAKAQAAYDKFIAEWTPPTE